MGQKNSIAVSDSDARKLRMDPHHVAEKVGAIMAKHESGDFLGLIIKNKKVLILVVGDTIECDLLLNSSKILSKEHFGYFRRSTIKNQQAFLF